MIIKVLFIGPFSSSFFLYLYKYNKYKCWHRPAWGTAGTGIVLYIYLLVAIQYLTHSQTVLTKKEGSDKMAQPIIIIIDE